jgi:hypothetical protein
LSFDHRNFDTLTQISDMDIGRFVVKFDEAYVNNRFPGFVNTPCNFSIKKFDPHSHYTINDNIDLAKRQFKFTTEHYNGVDFGSYNKGRLYFNYIGGDGYFAKGKEIGEVLEYYVIKTYDSINSDTYKPSEIESYRNVARRINNINKYYSDPELFSKFFDKIKLTINLSEDIQVIKTHWNIIRDPLFKLIIESNFNEGRFNYDSDFGRCQIMRAKVSNTTLDNYDLLICDVKSCVLKECNLMSTDVEDSRLTECTFTSSNKITGCYCAEAHSSNVNNEFFRCHIDNDEVVFEGSAKECVIMNASMTRLTDVYDGCVVLSKTPPEDMKVLQGIDVKEIRDYRWMKSLTAK